ncbi:TolC family protein [Porphyrobacter algicida]|uniref:TolC family protein n=1 Tax=Qipengyuania algicida TaxID=1836209 RepID=A0A845ASK0_9SPHN|nr:TolC family protein [Qipengyuania algicida]MXP29858.1 TolC family protein [Qipengyuania algicida]
MTSLIWRAALIPGLALAAAPLAAQADRGLTLDEALRLSGAIEASASSPSNPRIVGPQEDIAAAEAEIAQARLRPNPEVSLEVENVAGTGAFSGLRSSEYTLSAGLPIELGGKRNARIAAARAEADLARLRGELSLSELGYLVRRRFVAAVAAEAKVELAADILERDRELLRIADALVDAGREPPLRALRARAALAEAEAELKAAQADALATRFALGALWSQDAAPEVPPEFPAIEPPHDLIASYSGLETRIAAAERIAAETEIDRQRSLGVPDPTVSAGVKRFEESNDNAFVVGVSIPLPLRNRNQGSVAAAQARARAAGAREAVAMADYRQEVAQARADYLSAEAKSTTLEERSLPQAEEALRLAEIGYRNGKFPLLEVLAAADTRDSIRRSIIDAREAQGAAAARLIRLAAQ